MGVLQLKSFVPDAVQSRVVETPKMRRPLSSNFSKFSVMPKNKLAALLIYSAVSAIAASGASATSDADGPWRMYSEEPNGDVHFFDPSRVKSSGTVHQAWSRIRYKTSVMGAASYQSLLEVDCSEGTERILQNTFFSDKQWTKPSMSPDKMAKPKRAIAKGSATERLTKILCDQ